MKEKKWLLLDLTQGELGTRGNIHTRANESKNAWNYWELKIA